MGMIHDLLDERIAVEEFADRYWAYYLRKVPSDTFSDRDEAFFGGVQQKIDLMSDDIDDDDQAEMGWIEPEGFPEWLRGWLEDYESGDELQFD